MSLDTLKQWKIRPELKKKFYLWAIGSAGTTIAVVFQVLAQLYTDKSSLVAAFGGIGLMSLIIFSFFVLKERIKAPEWAGMILVAVATLVFGFTIDSASETGTVDYGMMGWICGIMLGLFLIFAVISHKLAYKGHAVIWGSIAGLFSGLGIALSQTAATAGNRDVLAMLLTLDLWLAIATGQGAFWGTQYGFKHGHTSIVVTFYNTFSIFIPVLVDIFVLHKNISLVPMIMLCLIGVGVVLLTAFREDAPAHTETVSVEQKL